LAVVAAPSYLKRNGMPRSPADLVQHRCIHLQLHANGTLLPWTFRKGRRELKVKAEGPLVFNSLAPIIRAATEGFGLAHTVADSVRDLVDQGKLVSVLEEWCPTVQGYHLYYPSRRHPPPAFTLLLETLRRQRDHAD
jgi:DNA-binding transcriptional LysR family regulator